MGSLPFSLLLLATIAVGATAFLAPKAHPSVFAVGKDQPNRLEPTNAAVSFATSSVSLLLSSSPDGNGRGSDAFLKARTDIRIFLTQRSIQSFVYLLNQCREEHTVRWLEVSRKSFRRTTRRLRQHCIRWIKQPKWFDEWMNSHGRLTNDLLALYVISFVPRHYDTLHAKQKNSHTRKHWTFVASTISTEPEPSTKPNFPNGTLSF
jgi:hypothetical protein